MNKTFEKSGFWWLPETPDNKIPGTLSFSPGDVLHLDLMGALNGAGEIKLPPPDFINPILIHGTSLNGESVTLYKCLQSGGNNSTGDAGTFYATEFIAHFAFFGTLFPTENDIKFNIISVRFHNLDNWYNKSCIHSTSPDPDSEVITFNSPPSIDIQLKDFLVQFSVYASQSYKINSASISTVARIEISSKSEKSFDDYLNLTRLIQNFLTLSITKPTYVTEIYGRLTESFELTDSANNSSININIFYDATGWQLNAPDVFWAHMLLPFSEIETILTDIFRIWIEKSEILKPVYDLYFAGFYKSTYPENEFLNLTQAIETYHRRTYGGKYQTDDEFLNGLYLTFISAIPSDVPDDFKTSLKKGKLRYANEYSLRKRILLLSEHLTNKIPVNFLRDKKTYSSFADKIADTRNYLTHYSPELKDKAITSGKGLFELNQQLGFILLICLLEELEIPFGKIIEIMKKNIRYQRFLA